MRYLSFLRSAVPMVKSLGAAIMGEEVDSPSKVKRDTARVIDARLYSRTDRTASNATNSSSEISELRTMALQVQSLAPRLLGLDLYRYRGAL